MSFIACNICEARAKWRVLVVLVLKIWWNSGLQMFFSAEFCSSLS